MTANQICTEIQRSARGGSVLSRDESWDQELIFAYFENYRSQQILKNAYLTFFSHRRPISIPSLDTHIDPQNLQDVYPLQLSTVDRNFVAGLPDRCTIKKVTGIMYNNTTYTIPDGQFPKIIDFPTKSGIVYLGTLNKKIPFIPTPVQYLQAYTASPLGAAFGRYFMIGNSFYIIPPNNDLSLCWIDMQAVFQSPRQIMSLLTGFTVAATDTSFFNAEYPCSPSLIADCIDQVMQGELRSMLTTPIAVSNKSTGVEELLQEEGVRRR